MELQQSFLQYIHAENLFTPDTGLLLAVSGGVDSAVLCALCHRCGFNFIIAHSNFQLRGEESGRDETFVRSLGEKYNKIVLVNAFETDRYAEEHKISIQVAARELRYRWFNDILEQKDSYADCKPQLILTAHHSDDNVETMLMNLFKGTGIAGLRAMLPKKGKIIRPLLFASKKQIEEFAEANDLQYVEDSSNLTDKYTRNYFRNSLLPAISGIFPKAAENLARNIPRFRQVEQLYMQAVGKHKKQLLEHKGSEIHIPVLKLRKTVPQETVTYEIIKDYGFAARQVEEVIALLASETGKYVDSPSNRIVRSRNWLIITPHDDGLSETIVINEDDHQVAFKSGVIKMKMAACTGSVETGSKFIATLDAASLRFPLLLRKRKIGDYFYPLGLQKKKKVSRFISDQKLSATERENTWVLLSNQKLIWVVGQRIDERFKVTPQTKNLLQLTLQVSG